MQEFRFVGIRPEGDRVTGTIYAPKAESARRKASDMAEKYQFRLEDLEGRKVYRYKVRDPEGREEVREQKAFSEDQLRDALRSIGLEVVWVRKKWWSLRWGPSREKVVRYVRQAANLIKGNLPFNDVLQLLEAEEDTPALRRMTADLRRDLESGVDARSAFLRHRGVLGKFAAYMLGMATESGNMAEMFEATARFMERKLEFKKDLRRAMFSPAVTLVATAAAFLWYVWDIVPRTVGLFDEFDVDLPPLTQASLEFARWMDAHYLWVGLVLGAVTAIGWVAARSRKGRFLLHRTLIRIPVLGALLHKLYVEIFCRVFAIVYSGSRDNLEVIRVAAEATDNLYLVHRVKTVMIPQMQNRGVQMAPAMEKAGVFTPLALSRFRSGLATGDVRESAQEVADYYQREASRELEVVVEAIQTVVWVIVAIAVAVLTILSVEMAAIQPSTETFM